MTIKKSELGIEVFLGALLLGIAGEALLFETSWGVGAMLWVGAVGALGVWLIQRWEAPLLAFEKWLLIPLGLLALSYAGRDAGMLKMATTTGLCAVWGLAMQSRQLHRVAGRVPGIFSTGTSALFGLPRFLRNTVRWDLLFSGIDKETTRSVFRGVLIVTPILLIFGVLLSSADKGFAGLMGRLFSFEMERLPARLSMIGLYAVVVAVYLRGILTDVVTARASKKVSKKKMSMLMLEVGIVLGLVNLMFATFVVMQLGYLFGGADYIETVEGVTLAGYARNGFFELILVAAISLGMTMFLKRAFKPASAAHIRLFDWLVVVQVGLLLVMLISAAQRMWLYTDAFGLTEDRLYACAFMAWLAFVLGWFAWTTISNNALGFVRGAVVAGTVVVLGLHVVNPEALIARVNMQRAIAGKTLDHAYLGSLSADAVPVMLELMPALSAQDRCRLGFRVIKEWQGQASNDWRAWNLSHHRAKVAVENGLASGVISNQWPVITVGSPGFSACASMQP